jgi:hypothetical protein
LHEHSGFTPSQIRLATLYLGRKLPAELIPRILNWAEYTTTCTRTCKRETKIIAGEHVPSPRLVRQAAARWTNGQEDDMSSEERHGGLKDTNGNVWFLASERVGCMETHDPVMERVDEDIVKSAKSEAEGSQARRDAQERRKVYLRQIHVRTLSKDQGWSTSNTESYGGWSGRGGNADSRDV